MRVESGEPRLINRYDSSEILLIPDGSCINNGSSDPVNDLRTGGYSFKYKGGGSSTKMGPVTTFVYEKMLEGQLGFLGAGGA